MAAAPALEKEHFYATIGDAIRTARRTAGLSQDGLGKLAGLSQSSVIQAENGNACTAFTLAKIAHALDTTLDALVPLEALP